MQHPGKTATGVGATRKAKQTDLVPFLVRLHQEAIGVFDVNTEAGAHRHVHGGGEASLQSSPVIGADPTLVVCNLLWAVLLQTLNQLDDVTVVGIELVARAVETDDDCAASLLVGVRISRRIGTKRKKLMLITG